MDRLDAVGEQSWRRDGVGLTGWMTNEARDWRAKEKRLDKRYGNYIPKKMFEHAVKIG